VEALILVGIGGAAGSILRYWLSKMQPLRGIPAGTLTVNVLGSFVLSILTFSGVTGSLYYLLCTGLLGGFTTFSTFGFETFRMIEDKDYRAVAANVLLNVFGGLLAVYAGYRILI
jgi:CrcB protein